MLLPPSACLGHDTGCGHATLQSCLTLSASPHPKGGSRGELAGVREAQEVVAQLCHLLLHRRVQAQRVAHRAHERQRRRAQLLLYLQVPMVISNSIFRFSHKLHAYMQLSCIAAGLLWRPSSLPCL